MNLRATSPTKEATAARAELATSVLAARVHREVTIPRTSVAGAMRLLSRKETAEVRAATRATLTPLATGPALEGFREWHEELAVRTLSVAVRLPSDTEKPLASLDDWQECDDEQIGAMWEWYQDLEAELDPLGGSSVALSPTDVDVMLAAAKKKAGVLLMSFGSRKLAAFATTLVEQQSS